MKTLKELAQQLKERGYKVFAYEGEFGNGDYSSITFGKPGNRAVGYVSKEYFGSFSIGRKYIPNKEFGSAYRFMKADEISVEEIEKTMETKLDLRDRKHKTNPEEWRDVDAWYTYEKRWNLFYEV